MNPQLNYIHRPANIAELHRRPNVRDSPRRALPSANPRERNPIIRLSVRLARLTARLAPSSP